MLTGRKAWRSAVRKLWTSTRLAHPGSPVRRDRLAFTAAGVAAEVEILETRQLLSAGAIDPTFGNGGMTAPLGTQPGAAPGSTAVQSNGETVVASTYWSSNQEQNHLVLARYTTNGTLDASFGTNGIVDMTFGKYANLTLTTIAIQSDGKILVAGGLDGNVVLGGFNNNAIEVLRFNSNGTLDKTFGSRGTFNDYVSLGDNTVESMAVDPQGRIILDVIVGNGTNGPAPGPINLVRLTSSGQLDSTFGNKGLDQASVSGYQDYALALQPSTSDPNGYEILVGGEGPVNNSIIPSAQLMVARFGSNGVVDTSFGTGGTVLVTPVLDPSQAAAGDFVHFAEATKLAIEADGSIVAAGVISVTTPSGSHFGDPVVMHFSADGVLDTSFGNGGDVVSVFSPEGYQVSGLSDVKIDAQGNILVVGSAKSSTGATYATLIRYTSTGQLDTSFGADGTGFVFAGPSLSGLTINIDPTNGNLIVTVNGSSGYQLIRYLGA